LTTKNKPAKAFVVVWEFHVKSVKRREFEKAYGPQGKWAELFRRNQAYIGTELIRDRETPGRYLTIDLWSSRGAYLRFKRRSAREYDEIDRRFQSLTESEVKVGEFCRVDGQLRP